MATLKIELTQHIVDNINFARQPFRRPSGETVWHKTKGSVHDWMLADTVTPGLLLRLTPSSIAWVLRRKLNGITTRRSLGTARAGFGSGQVLSLAEARKRAEQWRGLMASGQDPLDLKKQAHENRSVQQQRESITMGVAFEQYVKARKGKNADTTHKDRLAVQKWMEKSPLWRVPIVKLTRADVEQSLGPLLARAKAREKIEAEAEKQHLGKNEVKTKINAIKKCGWGPRRPGSVDRIYTYTQDAWKRAANELHLPPTMETPFLAWRKDVKWTVAKRRTRWLDTRRSEGQAWIKAVVGQWQAAHEETGLQSKPWHAALLDYYICVLIWGTRLTETTLLKWSQVDAERKVVWLAPETTKTQVLGCVPLTPWTAEIIEERRRLNVGWQPRSPFVFPSRHYNKHIVSPQKTLARINAAAGFTISTHDLRRTLATDIAGEKHPVEASSMLIAGAALQHAQRGGIASATTEGYVLNRAEILRPIYEKREDHLRQIAGLIALGKQAAANTDDTIIDRIVEDPALRKQLLTRLLQAPE